MKIAFLGAGRMASALVRGLIDSGLVSAKEIIVTSKDGASSNSLAKTTGVTASLENKTAVAGSSVIFLCTKPAQALATLSEVAQELRGKLIISVVTGIHASDLLEAAGEGARIIRSMPNTAVRLRKGITALAPHPSASSADVATATELFSSVGEVYEVREDKMDAVTAVSGSGPAFALLFLEAMAQGGIEGGLDPSLAMALSIGALAGAAALVKETGETPVSLRAEITSPGGTTQAGLTLLEEGNFPNLVKGAIRAARKRALELSQG